MSKTAHVNTQCPADPPLSYMLQGTSRCNRTRPCSTCAFVLSFFLTPQHVSPLPNLHFATCVWFRPIVLANPVLFCRRFGSEWTRASAAVPKEPPAPNTAMMKLRGERYCCVAIFKAVLGHGYWHHAADASTQVDKVQPAKTPTRVAPLMGWRGQRHCHALSPLLIGEDNHAHKEECCHGFGCLIHGERGHA